MKFTGTFKSITLDMERTKALIHTTMLEALTQVAFAWVNAAEETVPVWTGASKATFLLLANEIGFTMSIVPSPTAPSDSTGFGVAKSEGELGPVNAERGLYFFTYATTLDHLIENEQINANQVHGLKLKKPGPYHFQEKGREAFEKAACEIQLPAPVFRVRTKRIK